MKMFLGTRAFDSFQKHFADSYNEDIERFKNQLQQSIDDVYRRDNADTYDSLGSDRLNELDGKEGMIPQIDDVSEESLYNRIREESSISSRKVLILNGEKAGEVKAIKPGHYEIHYHVQRETDPSKVMVENPKREQTLIIDDEGNERWETTWEETSDYDPVDLDVVTLKVVKVFVGHYKMFVAVSEDVYEKISGINNSFRNVPDLIDITNADVSNLNVINALARFGKNRRDTDFSYGRGVTSI